MDQNLSLQRENTSLLKGNLAQKSWPIDAVVEADCRGRGSDSLGRFRGFNPAMNPPQFGGELASIVGRSGHNRTAIVSHDRD